VGADRRPDDRGSARGDRCDHAIVRRHSQGGRGALTAADADRLGAAARVPAT